MQHPTAMVVFVLSDLRHPSTVNTVWQTAGALDMDMDGLTALEAKWLDKRAEHHLRRELWTARDEAVLHTAWREIFEYYVTLATAGDAEAMKRSLYLAWARYAESFLSTGIRGLDEQAVETLLTVAEDWACAGRLDAELTWMLAYYYLVDNRYLEEFTGLDALKQVSRTAPLRYRTECLKAVFENRGLLGEYWRAKQRYLRSRQASQGAFAAVGAPESAPIAAA
jgi:hypothetical protein